MTDLTSLTITEAASRISSGKLSLLELTQAFLDRIARIDPQLNSYHNYSRCYPELQLCRISPPLYRRAG
jgi:Asp-tRNA(Asn)/Glu-tRNA(Gln) amidotransferase A subunit family amidase